MVADIRKKKASARLFGGAMCALALMACAAPVFAKPEAAKGASAGQYKNFKAAIYIAVSTARKLSDPAVFDVQFARAFSQVPFDKVYIETYRDRNFATDAELTRLKAMFKAKDIAVAGGVTLAAGGKGGQFGTFDYEDAADRAECQKAIELAAKHFDEVILDDFFFYTSKSDADIAAKGDRSWTQYRLETMRKVSQELVIGPAKRVNPKVKVIIKYPNWYEHFQGLGYDLEKQPLMFDGIYTGTETRDPVITDQLLQPYESYEVFRYYSNIRSDNQNGGGWVDTFSTRYIDRYAEQLWDTLFAKAPEITLFSWSQISEAKLAPEGTRPWADQATSLNWKAITTAYKPKGANDSGPGWGTAAGAALKAADAVVGQLGKPVGLASYKPFHSSGEDFLHNYLGQLGIPIELTPHFPTSAEAVLLTEAAAADPDIINRIKTQLKAGKTVIVTSGFVKATQDKGFKDIAEIYATGNRISVDDYYGGYGAGNGDSLRDSPDKAPKPVLIPDMHFYTNDSWPIVRGVAGARGAPIMLMNRYSKGILFVLTIPDNIGDLYDLPHGVVRNLKSYMLEQEPVVIDAPVNVALYAYDNGAFIVENYRDEAVSVRIGLKGDPSDLMDALTGTAIITRPKIDIKDSWARQRGQAARTEFEVSVPPHSFRLFKRAKP